MSDLLDSLKNEEGLLPMEVAFLDVLFDVCGGNVRAAMDEVGYDKKLPTSVVTKKLGKYIQQRSKEYLISQTARASVSLVSVLSDPNAVGTKNLLAAAKDILDRGAIVKEETASTVQHNHMFILPAKVESEIEEE